MRKKLLITAAVILTAVVAAFAALRLGAFVYPYSMGKLAEVPRFDILEGQFGREQEILADYQQDVYTLDGPYILLDPYGFNPLAALVLFETEQDCQVEVTVHGDNAYSTYTYTHAVEAPRAEVPVIGLYAGRENTVTLTCGAVSRTHKITTEPLPVTMQQYTLVSSQPERMAPGVTLFVAFFEHSNAALVDCDGQVRGYIAAPGMAQRTPLLLLENGHMLAGGDEYKMMPYNMASMFEYNWLGKIFVEYEVPHAVHHGVFELPGGDLLLTSNHRDMFATGTREDVAIVLDRQTGQVIKEYDFRQIVDETREPYHHFSPDIKNAPNRDWMHMNAAVYDEANNAVVVSSPSQSMVISIDADTAGINWILGPHDGYNDELKQYLLTPVGEDFEWQWCQHDSSILPNPGSPDTIDILLFDNGQARSFTEEGSVPAADNFSRAMHYRVNQKEMTVELLWQYGKDRDDYSTFLGSAEELGDTVLIAFGGQLRADDKPVDEILGGVFGSIATRSRVVEVTRAGEVVYEVSVREGAGAASAETYQARRLPLFVPAGYAYRLGEARGKRLGTSYTVAQTDEISPPNLYLRTISAQFHDLHREADRLIIDGTLLYKGERRLLGRAYLVFRGRRGQAFVYAANSGINGRFMASVDLTQLPPGEYELAVAGGLMEGNDALDGKTHMGHFRTGYKVTVG